MGIVRDSKKLFPKQLSPKVSTDEGIMILFNCLQPLMKKEGSLIRLEDSCKDSNAMQSLKQYWPIWVTDEGNESELILVHPLKQ